MKLEKLGRDLQFSPEEIERIRPRWTDDAALETVPEFLTPEFFRRYRDGLGLPDAELDELDRLTIKVHAAAMRSPALCAYCNWLFCTSYLERGIFYAGNLPEPAALLGEAAGMPALLISLGAVPLVERRYAELGIPAHYAAGPLGWIGGTVRIYQSGHEGRLGQCLSQTFWLRHSVDGELFRIGRFEFQLHHPPCWALPLYREISTGRTVLFADPEWWIDAEGFIARPGTPGAVKMEFSDVGGRLRGHVVDPASGRVRREVIELDAARFLPAVAAHDLVVDVHIPGGGNMTLERAEASFREAVEFFRRYFRREVRAFVCNSWILNPDWQTELPDSNLAKFQRELYLYPGGVDPACGIFFIFGRMDDDRSRCPADNSVRRAFHRVWDAGRELRPGGMVILGADLDRFGSGTYRNFPVAGTGCGA